MKGNVLWLCVCVYSDDSYTIYVFLFHNIEFIIFIIITFNKIMAANQRFCNVFLIDKVNHWNLCNVLQNDWTNSREFFCEMILIVFKN